MIKDELIAYGKIFGISALQVVKFAAAGIAINWIFGLYKIFWYGALFNAGGWYIALAVVAVLLFFIAIPALYIYMGYQHAIGNAIMHAYNKNQDFVNGMVGRVVRKIAGVPQIAQAIGHTTAIAGNTNELRIVRFMMKRMGMETQWQQLSAAGQSGDPQTRVATVEAIVQNVVTTLPQKIAEGFTTNLRKLILINIVVLIFIEVFSRVYPA